MQCDFYHLRFNMIENLLCLCFIPFIYKTVHGFVMCNLKASDNLRAAFCVFLHAIDVYVLLETTGAAIKIARGTTNNQ